MNIETIKSVYFVGAGGIGMSALIRYFLSKGKFVAGYDRTPSELTGHLIAEGAQIHYEENTGLIPENCKDKESTLVVYTPAIPQEHAELAYFRENGFEIHKRSQVLGTITRSSKGLCVAGTHGKTTTSTMAAHLPPVACGLHGFSRRHLQELRDKPALISGQSVHRNRSRRVRPFVPLAFSLYERYHLYRPRPFGHIRHARGLS